MALETNGYNTIKVKVNKEGDTAKQLAIADAKEVVLNGSPAWCRPIDVALGTVTYGKCGCSCTQGSEPTKTYPRIILSSSSENYRIGEANWGDTLRFSVSSETSSGYKYFIENNDHSYFKYRFSNKDTSSPWWYNPATSTSGTTSDWTYASPSSVGRYDIVMNNTFYDYDSFEVNIKYEKCHTMYANSSINIPSGSYQLLGESNSVPELWNIPKKLKIVFKSIEGQQGEYEYYYTYYIDITSVEQLDSSQSILLDEHDEIFDELRILFSDYSESTWNVGIKWQPGLYPPDELYVEYLGVVTPY